ncbi:Pleckstrin homology domain-containing protein [Phialemonium atrogriseum]|uniref:Pleckstrin homology domain-containing protein n=1 Tax=Phialemonium atrogriseum TaxID=1093897 RepID=A0AAJ0BVL8_9PEZI|nr:guanine nucleotide exchange factor [Phialemonium atrogriseum]KAK1764822.1 Pleckstrin homology domain-containing protein [Phialemonium atrogriseum]
MAEEQKPVEVPTETISTEPATETKVEETPATAAEATEAAAPAAETSAGTEAAPAEEAAKKEDEVTPIEAGSLEHKGSNFPKNILYSKKNFWFGSEPVDTKVLTSFKADKAVTVAHHIAAWASETGKGLFFFGERSDKTAPQGAIHLAEASDPVPEGANKFHFSAKGLKHTFKAASSTERDNWVGQLKLKIAEAKELVPIVTESENYKKTIESFKPAAKEKAPAAPVAEAAKEETAAEAAPKDAAETPAEEAKEDDKKEEPKKEEPKRRSASRKRTSIFGNLLGNKKEEEKKAAEPAEEAKAAESTEAPVEASTAAAAEATVEPIEAAPEAVVADAAPAAEAVKAEEPRPELKATKRGSIFGSFLKKKSAEPEAAPSAPAKDAPAAAEAVAETAPVIPAVETTEPLSTEVTSADNAAAETAEPAVAVTNGESKKEVRSDKRKSSLPFGFGAKKEKSATSDEETEKPKSPSPFSKLRATIKGKGKADKPAEKADEKAEDKPTEAEASKDAEPAKEETAEPAEAVAVTEAAVPAEKPIASTPVIQAAA